MYLERPQIDRLLNKAVQSPLVTVVAGAGYGKTHAVYAFLQHCPAVSRWIQLSERDNNPDRFWEHYIGAVESVSKTIAGSLAELGFPRTERQYDRYNAVPRTDVIPGRKYIFVYDDFHLLNNPEVLLFLERAVMAPFHNITAVIISRSEPPFNLISRFSKGLLARITEDELRFTPEEMGLYFALQDLRLSPEDAAAVYRDTEGWAFAIHLAGLSLKKSAAGTYSPSLMRDNISRHIEREIYSLLSEGLQRLLVKLSLIDQLPVELLGDIADDDTLAGELGKTGALVSFDMYLNAYRIHPLFLRYLEGKQDSLSDEEKRTVYEKAARWCAKHNLRMDAFSYYEKAGNYGAIFNLVYTLPMLIPDAIAEFLLDILKRAPPEVFSGYVSAPVVYNRLLIVLGRFDEAAAWCREVISRYEALPLSTSSGQVLARCYNGMGFNRLLNCVFDGQYDFSSYFEKGARYYALSNDGPTMFMDVPSYMCMVGICAQGEMKKFIDALSASVPPLLSSLNGCGYGMDYLARAELAFFRADLEGAEQFCSQAVRNAQAKNQYEIKHRALFYLLRISAARGDAEKTAERLLQMNAMAEDVSFFNRHTFNDIGCGWFYAHLGETEKLAPWLKSDFEKSDLNSLTHGFETLVMAKGRFAEKNFPAALSALENIRTSRHGAGVFLLGRLEKTALEAVCRYRRDDTAGAFTSLKAAYALAEPEGLDMPFIELGRDMRTLAAVALKEKECPVPRLWLEKIQRNAASYAKKFTAVEEAFRNGGDTEILSPRERKILSALARGFTRDEIARDNRLAINSVKSILSRIYRKLGALNRADAVRIAAARGLVGRHH
ncbi:helix-turn-helix transcriptional regulator [Spirochaetia bacterium]|nr:helix-turn-helix transcriptional regulator [Spirochaetia bacterium]